MQQLHGLFAITLLPIARFRSDVVQTEQMTLNVLQLLKVKGQGHSMKRHLIVKLLLSFRKSGSLNLMAMSEC